jgi:hypothetical protein
LEGQTYYFPDGNYPHCIDGVEIWGTDALKFEPFMDAVDFEPKPCTTTDDGNGNVSIQLGEHKLRQVQPLIPHKFDPRYIAPATRNGMMDTMMAHFMNETLGGLGQPSTNAEERKAAFERLSELTGRGLKDLISKYESAVWNG